MLNRLAIAAGIIALTLLSYWQFPGHTYLGSDTQIYVPMLDHIWDPSVLTHDLVATKPHLAYTLYDEIAVALRWITGSSFEAVLTGQQLVFRALQILGVFLLAASFPLTRRMAMLVAALFTLGATIAGPAVLVFEYEPVPRGFAIGLIFFAIGLAAQEHLMLADIAAAVAFLYHAPTVLPFWALYILLTLRRRHYRDLWPLAAGIVLLAVSSRFQAGGSEAQELFSRVSPELEQLQRMRAGYSWVSTWPAELLRQFGLFWIASMVAWWRVRPKAGMLFFIGLPTIGLLSIPLSFVLLEKLKWGLVPQVQPARAVLFVTAFVMILGAAAAIRAAERKIWIESILWFALVVAVPTSTRILSMSFRQAVLVAALAAAFSASIFLHRFRWAPALLIAVAIAPFFVLPGPARVRNYPLLPLGGVDDLARYARNRTSNNAVFLFGDAGRGPFPSIFRACSDRAVYVDWKSGGQINYSESIAQEWWTRWQSVNALQFRPREVEGLGDLGIDYLVLGSSLRLNDRPPTYENREFVVYGLRPR